VVGATVVGISDGTVNEFSKINSGDYSLVYYYLLLFLNKYTTLCI
jgi:hypothetical protein